MAGRRRYNLDLAPDFQQVAADIAVAEAVDIAVADTVVEVGFRRRYTTH